MNHFPKSSVITRKDTLLRALRKMRAVHGKIFDFFPDGFILPSEYTKFVEDYSTQGSASSQIYASNIVFSKLALAYLLTAAASLRNESDLDLQALRLQPWA
jgi:hypothetical protein